MNPHLLKHGRRAAECPVLLFRNSYIHGSIVDAHCALHSIEMVHVNTLCDLYKSYFLYTWVSGLNVIWNSKVRKNENVLNSLRM